MMDPPIALIQNVKMMVVMVEAFAEVDGTTRLKVFILLHDSVLALNLDLMVLAFG